ncbi:class I SAM-dependent methyltransferase [candidate division KSB1 bacterium]|nr:class I SAM-dependent methyltransferase [candidate division KSB1 bacterium]
MFEKLKSHWRRQFKELEVKEAYAAWASTYSPSAHNPLMELEQRAVLELLPDPAGKTALDLACGSGRYLATLVERGAAPVIGLDISPQMLARARTNSRHLVQADLRWLPLANSSFEVVVCGLAAGHVDDLRGVMIEVGRVLVSDGIVVYSDFHPFGSLAGWKRTFRAENGREYAVRQHTHLYADHHAACRAAGLVIEEVREPRIDFEHKWRGYPAVLVIRARKT